MQNSISRICCYKCKYSSTHRVGDISIGDYWNIVDVLPKFNSSNGASVVLINTKKGLSLFEKIKNTLTYNETSLEDAIQGNGNLSEPCRMPSNRLNIYKRIAKVGYKAIEKEECKYQYILPTVKKMIPKFIKRSVKKLLKRVFR